MGEWEVHVIFSNISYNTWQTTKQKYSMREMIDEKTLRFEEI
jgi:hypothetical protein